MTHRTVDGLPDAGKLHPYNHRDRADDVVVDVIRPGDLVAVTVTVRGATLRPPAVPDAADAHSVLVAGPDAVLVVDFPFQHAHEEASYEVTTKVRQADPQDPEAEGTLSTETALPAQKPARYRPGRGSRLVFGAADRQHDRLHDRRHPRCAPLARCRAAPERCGTRHAPAAL